MRKQTWIRRRGRMFGFALAAASSFAGCSSGSSGGESAGRDDPGLQPAARQPSGRQGASESERRLSDAASGGFSTAVARSELREHALELLNELAFSELAEVRANAIEGLQSAPQRVEPIVRAGLADTNLGVRFVAAMTVGKLRLKNTVPLVRPLLHDSSSHVRAAAAYALARNGVQVDLTPISYMLTSGDIWERRQAAYVLGELGNASAIPMLKDAAKQSTTLPKLERKLFELHLSEALAKLGDSTALHTIRAALYTSSREDVESAVVAAQMVGELQDRDSVWQLVQLVEQTIDRPAGTPVQPGGERPNWPNPATAQYLQPKELRLAATTALAKMGYPDGLYVAEQYVSDPDPAVRAQVTFLYGAAGSAGGDRSLERLSALMRDESPQVRVAAASAVLRILGQG